MILHLLIYGQRTEKQFASYVVRQFSDSTMSSEFVFMCSDKKIIDFESYHNVRSVDPSNREEMMSLYDSLSNYSAIVFHGLFAPWCEAVLQKVPDRVKVAWVFWGGEVFSRHDMARSILAPCSRAVWMGRNIILGIRGKHEKYYEIPKSLFKRVNYCLTDMEEEYEFAKYYLDVPGMKFHWYNYYSIDETLGDLVDCRCAGKNVILGNSATIECNYFDAIPIVKKYIRSMSLLVPLGYGSPWVRNLVVKYGMFSLGDSFIPMIDYMPRSEYNKVLQSCSTMIQPHYRPQAQGNIITGLWLGMRVYLSERNFAYQYFKRIGVSVYSIEHDLKHGSVSCEPVDSKVLDNNRRILKYWYGKEEMRSRILDLVSVLES